MHFFLASGADVNVRIKPASSFFGALRDSILYNKSVNFYVALVLSVVLHGSELWSLRADLFQCLGSFRN